MTLSQSKIKIKVGLQVAICNDKCVYITVHENVVLHLCFAWMTLVHENKSPPSVTKCHLFKLRSEQSSIYGLPLEYEMWLMLRIGCYLGALAVMIDCIY